MHYFTDNPWPIIVPLLAVMIVMFLVGGNKGRLVGIGCLLVAVGVFLLEQYLVSPAEEVEMQIEQMLVHFKKKSLPDIEQQISADRTDLVGIAENGLNLVTLSESFHIGSVEVTVDDDSSSASALVRANGSVTLLKHGGGSRHVPTFWRLTWKQEGSAWKLSEVVRLNPANGEEMGILAAH